MMSDPLGQCLHCHSGIEPGTSLRCLICRDAAHNACVGVDVRDLTILNVIASADIGWVCKRCGDLARLSLTSPPSTNDPASSTFSSDTAVILKAIADVKRLLVEHPSQTATVTDTGPAARGYAGALRAGLPEAFPPPPAAASPNTTVAQLLVSSAEEVERSRSLVMSGLKPKPHTSDHRLVIEFIREHLEMDLSHSILRVTRLGLPSPGRVLLARVTLTDAILASDVLTTSSCLRASDDPDARGVYFNYDRSREEQYEEYLVRQARRERITLREDLLRRQLESRQGGASGSHPQSASASLLTSSITRVPNSPVPKPAPSSPAGTPQKSASRGQGPVDAPPLNQRADASGRRAAGTDSTPHPDGEGWATAGHRRSSRRSSRRTTSSSPSSPPPTPSSRRD